MPGHNNTYDVCKGFFKTLENRFVTGGDYDTKDTL